MFNVALGLLIQTGKYGLNDRLDGRYPNQKRRTARTTYAERKVAACDQGAVSL